jgi:hypothetical protein
MSDSWRLRPCLAALLFVFSAAPARAHEYWLAPSSYAAAPGREIRVAALAGTGFRGERKPWAPNRCVRFVARAARMLDLAPGASFANETWARFAPSDKGGALLAYQSDFTRIELPADAFDAYLAAEGLDGPRRCAKTWLAGAEQRRATQPLGLPLELVPLAVPGRDASLPLRVLWNGKPLKGALVKAWRAPLAADGLPIDPATRDSIPVAWQTRSDAHGGVRVAVADAGEWMVSVVHMVPCADRAQADWESTWASLTFERPATLEAAP